MTIERRDESQAIRQGFVKKQLVRELERVKKGAVTLAFVLGASHAAAQSGEGSLTGRVSESGAGRSLEGAIVTIPMPVAASRSPISHRVSTRL